MTTMPNAAPTMRRDVSGGSVRARPGPVGKGTFHRDPLGTFDRWLATGEEAFRLTPDAVCVAEPAAAKAVLANPDGDFEAHSDFFHTSRGAFGPRAEQLRIGRAARALLARHLVLLRDRLDDDVDRSLLPTSEWPDAGNRLLLQGLREVLVAPEHEHRLGATVSQIVEWSVRAGARTRRFTWRRFLYKRRVRSCLEREIRIRYDQLSSGQADPADLFDVLASTPDADRRAAELGQLYLPLLFAITGSVGFTLGWCLHLLGTHPPTGAKSAWIVREALRLWPIAWQLGRRPVREHVVCDMSVTPADWVVVSPYVTQRHPRYWSDAEAFRPERWSMRAEHEAFLPFGWGPHTCVAAGLTYEIVAAMLDSLLGRYRLRLVPLGDRPFIGPSLAPPRFRLDLTVRQPQ